LNGLNAVRAAHTAPRNPAATSLDLAYAFLNVFAIVFLGVLGDLGG
jgi:hypothetical protein